MDPDVQLVDRFAYWLMLSYADMIDEVTLELQCRNCGVPPELHPTRRAPEWGDDSFLTATLDQGDGKASVPGRTTNLPCVISVDNEDNLFVTDWAMIVTIEWGSQSRCEVHTMDEEWRATIEDETGCEHWLSL